MSTEAPSAAPQQYRFGVFELQPAERRLLKAGEPVALPGRAFDLLLALVERAGSLVSKDELLERVWPKLVVEESNLQVHVSALRKVLGQDAIATVIGRGYRFAMALESASLASPISPAPAPAPVATPPRRFLVAAIVASALLAIGLAAWLGTHGMKRGEAHTTGAVRSVAVLPFKRLYPGDSRDDYLSVGLADALIVHLGSLRRLIVRPTTSVLRYEGTTDPLAAAREQGVDSVLTGTIQHTGESIRVAAQLIDASNGSSLWAGKFDEKPSDLFKLEDSLSQQIAQALLRRLDDSERERLMQRSTHDPEAYQLYLRGKYQWSRFSEAGLAKAAEYYGRAIEKDPNFALAYAGLAATHNVRGAMGFVTPRSAWQNTREYAQKAVALDPNLPEAHVARAAERILYAWDFPSARRELERAIELNPNLGEPYSLLSYVEEAEARLSAAVEVVRKAVALDPVSALYNVDLASAYYYQGRFEESAAAWDRAAEIDPAFNASLHVGAQALERLGRYPQAIAECERLAKHVGRAPSVLAALSYALASSGDRARARAIADEMAASWKMRYFPPMLVALAYAGVHEDAMATEWLQRAIDSRDPQVLWLALDPQLERLHARPEWARLVRQVGVVQPAVPAR